MNKEEKYKNLAKIFLKRLITLEKDAMILQNELENQSTKHIIKIFVETNDIIPFVELSTLLETDDEMFEDLLEIINNCEYKNLDKEVEKFFDKYVKDR